MPTPLPDDRFWAKLERGDADRLTSWHSVIDHCADVAAVFEALLQRPLIRERLGRVAGLGELPAGVPERLSVLAALHDVGKYNHGFQVRRRPSPPFRAGHVREVLSLLGGAHPQADRFLEAIDAETLLGWGAGGGDLVAQYLVTALAHHGRPQPLHGARHSLAKLWAPAEERDPMEGVRALVAATRQWFPGAYVAGASPLPASVPLQHAFNGLLTLADWMGSDTAFFPLADGREPDRFEASRERASRSLRVTGFAPDAGRTTIEGADLDYESIWGFSPHSTQQHVRELGVEPGGSLTVLEASTGSGKTEAAILRYLHLFRAGEVDGMYFALPTRAAAKQVHRRVCEAAERVFGSDPDTRPPVVLAVPGYLRVDDADAQRLPGFEVLWPDELDGHRSRTWAAERPKRYLAGSIVVGTIDQVLLSALKVGHAHLRASALLRHLLVVDEVHASDVYMTEVLGRVLGRHLGAGGYAFLMSATLGSVARSRYLALPDSFASSPPSLEDAASLPYPAVSHQPVGGDRRLVPARPSGSAKRVRVEAAPGASDVEAVARRALEAARQGARVLVIRNTVSGAQHTQGALERQAGEGDEHLLFRCHGTVTPHHSRYAAPDRHALDNAVEDQFGKGAGRSHGCVLVATQTVEQSLDIDADLLITDLCPVDVLLQRFGRLHRHVRTDRPSGYRTPRARILVPEERDLGRWIATDGRLSGAMLGPHGWGTVYEDGRVLEATWRELEARRAWTVPDDNRILVERGTHPERLAALVGELDGPWKEHAAYIEGLRSARGQMARLNLVDWSLPFTDPDALFPDSIEDRRVQSRLGEGDRRIVFEEPFTSPFGQLVEELTLPFHLAPGGVDEEGATVPARRMGDGVRFRVAGHPFRYDRKGLQPVAEDE